MSKSKRLTAKKKKKRRQSDPEFATPKNTRIKLNVSTDLCPCRKGKIIENCCLQPDGRLVPAGFKLKRSDSVTEFSNQRCYANMLNDCSEKLSDEHYLSKSILEQLSGDGWSVEVEGLAWQAKDIKKKVAVSALVSKILCEKHNQALSGLDSIAQHFFKTITQGYVDTVQGTDTSHDISLFNGHDIERWMLKTLIGLCYSGNAPSQTGKIEDWTPDIRWIEILFQGKPFPNRWGIYCPAKLGHKIQETGAIGFNAITNIHDGIDGGIIDIKSTRFILVMANLPQDLKHTILDGHIHRPDELVQLGRSHRTHLLLGWEQRGTGGSITSKLEVRLS